MRENGSQHEARTGQNGTASSSSSMVSFETSPAIAAYLADRQLQGRPQSRPQSPSSWSRQLALLQRGNKTGRHAVESRPRPTRKAANYASAGSQYSRQHSHQHGYQNGDDSSETLDGDLDFDEDSTALLLQAYSNRAAAGRLEAALHVLQGIIKAGRVDVLSRYAVQSSSVL